MQVKNYLNSYRASRANKFIVYFQNFTNTYDNKEKEKRNTTLSLLLINLSTGWQSITKSFMETVDSMSSLAIHRMFQWRIYHT